MRRQSRLCSILRKVNGINVWGGSSFFHFSIALLRWQRTSELWSTGCCLSCEVLLVSCPYYSISWIKALHQISPDVIYEITLSLFTTLPFFCLCRARHELLPLNVIDAELVSVGLFFYFVPPSLATVRFVRFEEPPVNHTTVSCRASSVSVYSHPMYVGRYVKMYAC